ncbi:MAG TPA: sigma-70 family RNA polymerase sigma factor [Gemmatimonadales bacterium]|nr:sigma-70 family RNA polymerase sigma factor [Gemmatimonadales bacterium]
MAAFLVQLGGMLVGAPRRWYDWSMADPTDLSSPLERLVTRFARMVRHVGRTRGLSDPDLDELIQEVRIRVWRARPGMIGGLNAAYVHRAAVSAALDIIRRRRRAREEPLESAGPLAGSVGPADATELGDLTERVARAVDSLPPSRRPVVRMHLAGYPREEIAGLLGWSEAKTRNLLYRGLADLRAVLLGQGIGPGSAM